MFTLAGRTVSTPLSFPQLERLADTAPMVIGPTYEFYLGLWTPNIYMNPNALNDTRKGE